MKEVNVTETDQVNAVPAQGSDTQLAQYNMNGDLIPAADGAVTFGFDNPAQSLYTSLPHDGSRESSIRIYNAIGAAGVKLQELTDAIVVTDLVVHMVQLVNEETGELEDVPRVVLIDENGIGYDAVSKGVMSSLRRIMGTVGVAPWKPGLKVKPRRVKARNGFYTMTLDLIVN